MQADYVIVGAGSAGCAMALRLAEAGRSVIVVEHGGSDRSPLIRMPGALSYPMNMARYDWGYRTEPEHHLGGRRLACPRGKVLGGSSSINGMVYVRGHPRDFDHWAEAGAAGWASADVLPYFRRMECWHGPGDGATRGREGPLHVTRGAGQNPLVRAFLQAGGQAGHPLTGDYNGAQQEGFGAFEMTVWNGQRWSAAQAYLRPALRLGARVIRGLVERVVFDGRRAVAVALSGGREVRAGREVILCAGAINSPKLLMLSGIGPAAHLARRGVEVLIDRPGVGANLQDHLELYVQYEATQPVSLFRYWNLLGKAYVGARWLFTRSGPGASNQFEACAFLRSGPQADYPDLQFHFLPLAVRYDGRTAVRGHGFQIHVGPMRSPSRGAVRLADPDPASAPRIRFNYMSHKADWRVFRAGIAKVREVVAQPALAAFAGTELLPGPDGDDAAILEHAESAYHPCGTCRMGRADDADAVVDPHGRVIGVDGLRVADASVFPRITNGNTNAPAIMVGEKIADHVLDRSLPREAWPPVSGAVNGG